MFISPKRKNTTLENYLFYPKLTIRCQKVENRLPHTNSKLLLIWQAEKLSTWLLSSGQDFGKKFLDSKHVLKVYFKPSRKNQNFLFLPLCSVVVWLKILHLMDKIPYFSFPTFQWYDLSYDFILKFSKLIFQWETKFSLGILCSKPYFKHFI